jgi:K+-transporting ATPase ATPase A chain
MHKVEAPLYRLAGTSADANMKWSQYALALLAFNALGLVAVYALQRLQVWLPLNPAGMAPCARLGLQHRDQFCLQHQLAGLCR